MTKTKVEALANFVKAEYSASRFAGIMKREKVVASRGSLKWARCSAAVVCSHAVPPEGEARKPVARPSPITLFLHQMRLTQRLTPKAPMIKI